MANLHLKLYRFASLDDNFKFSAVIINFVLYFNKEMFMHEFQVTLRNILTCAAQRLPCKI